MQTFQASLFDELTPLYPDTPASDGRSHHRVAGANGTYVGVHIMLDHLTPGIPVSLEIQGPHRCYQTFQLLALPVEVNTGAKQRTEYLKNDVNEHVIRRAPFMVYDVLEPFFKIFQPAYTTAALAVKIPIEYCRKQHTDTFTLLVSHGGVSRQLTLFVDAFPAVVPRAAQSAFQYVNWFNLDHIADAFRCEKWSGRFWRLLEQYMRAAAFSRQNVFQIELCEIFELDGRGRPRLNEDRLSALTALAQKSGMAYFQGGAFAGRLCPTGDNAAFYNSLDHSRIQSPDEIAEAFKTAAFDEFDHVTEAKVLVTGTPLSTAQGAEELADMAEQLYAYLAKSGLTEIWTQCCLDEPNEALEPVYRKINGIVRGAMPGVMLLEPTLVGHPLEGTMDIWCPTVAEYEQNRDFYTDRAARGDQLWVYTCLTPGGNYCNRLLDQERLRQVWLGWAPIRYPDIQGFLHWGGTFYQSAGPDRRQSAFFKEPVLEFHPKYAMFLPAGDGCIFFPGRNAPLICTRSEAQRVGLEDLCLLEQLREFAPERTGQLLDRVFRGFADFETDPAVYRAVRRELLEALSQ